MRGAPFHKLTVGQIECLRLAAEGLSSKEIARRLGRRASAIDDRIARAVEALGAENRRMAAAWLAEHEGRVGGRNTPDLLSPAAPDPHTPDPRALDSDPIAGILAASSIGADGSGSTREGAVREVQAAFEHETASPQIPQLPLPFRRSRRNDLTILTRLALIPVLAVAIMIAFGILLGGMDSLARIFAALPRK